MPETQPKVYIEPVKSTDTPNEFGYLTWEGVLFQFDAMAKLDESNRFEVRMREKERTLSKGHCEIDDLMYNVVRRRAEEHARQIGGTVEDRTGRAQ